MNAGKSAGRGLHKFLQIRIQHLANELTVILQPILRRNENQLDRLQGFRHRGKTNVAFCDGHAETLRNRYTENADGPANVSAMTGFLSKNNALYGGREH